MAITVNQPVENEFPDTTKMMHEAIDDLMIKCSAVRHCDSVKGIRLHVKYDKHAEPECVFASATLTMRVCGYSKPLELPSRANRE